MGPGPPQTTQQYLQDSVDEMLVVGVPYIQRGWWVVRVTDGVQQLLGLGWRVTNYGVTNIAKSTWMHATITHRS